jgi:hypothetical protein
MSIKTSRVYFNIVMLRANVIPVNPQIHANVIPSLKATDISAVQILKFNGSFFLLYKALKHSL